MVKLKKLIKKYLTISQFKTTLKTKFRKRYRFLKKITKTIFVKDKQLFNQKCKFYTNN